MLKLLLSLQQIGILEMITNSPRKIAEEYRQQMADGRSWRLAAVKGFVQCARTGDSDSIRQCLMALNKESAYRAAFHAVGKLQSVPDHFRDAFLLIWINEGDTLRENVNDDQALVSCLKILLPRYTGPSLTLYRGDSAWNRRYRSYGCAWSSDPEVARGFAKGVCRTQMGGSVLLKNDVPADAIICAPYEHTDKFEEREYIVDRIKLKRVEVVERFPQISLEEHAALGAEAELNNV